MGATEHLLVLLANQREVLTRLQELGRTERESLLNSQLDQLEGIVQEQGRLLSSQARLSSRIAQLLARLSQELQLTGTPTLSNIAESLTGPDAQTIRSYCRELNAMAEDVQREGRVNWYLSQHALKYVDFTIKLIGRSKDGPMPYLPTAQPRAARPMQFLLDNQA